MAGFINNFTFNGNVGNEPEMRYLADGTAVYTFNIALSVLKGKGDDRKFVPIWFKVTAWNKVAEGINGKLAKGNSALVSGEVGEEEYTNKEGVLVKQLTLRASAVFPVPRDNSGGATSAPARNDDIPF